MYLSKLLLNPRSSEVRRDLADCQQMHRTLLSAFPQKSQADAGAREEFGVLYRADIQPRTLAVSLLVQSAHKPDWSRLRDGYLLTAPEEPREVAAIYQALPAGQRLRFRLRANPTRAITDVDSNGQIKKNSKRVELRDEAAQIAWLQRKAESGGFALAALRLVPEVANTRVQEVGKVYGWHEHQGQRKKMTLATAVFEGELVITDAVQFQQTLRQGIGRGKAYGFGLLSIAPV